MSKSTRTRLKKIYFLNCTNDCTVLGLMIEFTLHAHCVGKLRPNSIDPCAVSVFFAQSSENNKKNNKITSNDQRYRLPRKCNILLNHIIMQHLDILLNIIVS